MFDLSPLMSPLAPLSHLSDLNLDVYRESIDSVDSFNSMNSLESIGSIDFEVNLTSLQPQNDSSEPLIDVPLSSEPQLSSELSSKLQLNVPLSSEIVLSSQSQMNVPLSSERSEPRRNVYADSNYMRHPRSVPSEQPYEQPYEHPYHRSQPIPIPSSVPVSDDLTRAYAQHVAVDYVPQCMVRKPSQPKPKQQIQVGNQWILPITGEGEQIWNPHKVEGKRRRAVLTILQANPGRWIDLRQLAEFLHVEMKILSPSFSRDRLSNLVGRLKGLVPQKGESYVYRQKIKRRVELMYLTTH